MESLTINYSRRRFIFLIFLMLLGTAAGFSWGYRFGYNQGKTDILKQMEQRLNSSPARPQM
jgi:hypothetical protein